MEAWKREKAVGLFCEQHLYVGLKDQDLRLLANSSYCPLDTCFLAKQTREHFLGFDLDVLP